MITIRKTFNIVEIVNEIGKEVDSVLENRNGEKYFECIVLLYSLSENLLKWLIFIKTIWERTKKSIEPSEKQYLEAWNKLQDVCKNLSFYSALNIGLALDVIDLTFYKKLDRVRDERNSIAHQLWVFEQRQNELVLRKRLERLAIVAKQLTKVTSQLTNEIGLEEIYTVELHVRNKQRKAVGN